MESLSERFDARVVSLYSRSLGDGIPDGLVGPAQFYSFSCFDAIKVTAVELQNQSVLKSAYQTAMGMPHMLQVGKDRQITKTRSLPQFLLTFTDITGEASPWGYAAEQIRNFWDAKTRHPLFFMTLINVAENAQLETVLQRIKQSFPADRHLTYLTFDHCSAVIFYRGDSFDEYTHHIFNLYYTGDVVLADAITIFNFVPDQTGKLYTEEDSFHALIRIGVRDYEAAEQFCRRVKKENKTPGFRRGWLLERNDMWIYAPCATLRWLREVREQALASSREHPEAFPWFTTYELTILARMDYIRPSPAPAPINTDNLRKQIEDGYLEFKAAYIKSVSQLRLAQDQVWLRWLRESSNLAVSLMESQLSTELGICLVPQFLDLFRYAKRLFNSSAMNRDTMEAAQRSFSTFFSNIAILIDSMNQSNSQFIQVPSFHLTSFEMPPQLMAFYVAMAYRLKDILQDDAPDTLYCFTISPKFIKSLGVRSLAVQEVLPKDQWLEMVIGESSLYTMQLTVETMAHEVSHFVGQIHRNREARKYYELKYAFHEIIAYLLDALPEWLHRQLKGVPWNKLIRPGEVWCWESAVSYTMCQLLNAADVFWATAKDLRQFSLQEQNFSRDLFDLVLNLPGMLLNIPDLFRCVSDQVFLIAFPSECEEVGYLSLQELMLRWSNLEYGTGVRDGISLEEQVFEQDSSQLAREILRDEIDSAVESLLSEYAMRIRRNRETELGDGSIKETQEYRLFRKMRYLFSETFSDLQAILLLQLNWKQYCAMLYREEDVELIRDIPPRMLAVAKAIAPDVWKRDPIHSGRTALEAIERLVFEDPVEHPSHFQNLNISGTGDESTSVNIETGLLYYLTEYLKCCKIKIEASFKDNVSVRDLRKVHSALSDKSSVLQLQQTLVKFIQDFQQGLCETK